MKTKILIPFLAIIITTLSCSKKDDTPEKVDYPEENPLALFLDKTGFNQQTKNLVDIIYAEQGFKFKPKVKGLIKAVTCKIPNNSTNIRVNIWNADTKAILRTIIIPKATPHITVRQEIDPLEILPAETYVISFNENDVYTHERTDRGNAVFPVDAENITILGVQFKYGQLQEFPHLTVANSYWGDVSFVFKRTE